MKNAPFEEIPVPAGTTDAEAVAARKRRQTVLDHHPAAPYDKAADGQQRNKKPKAAAKGE